MKKWLLRILTILLFLLFVTAAAGYLYVSNLAPDYSEQSKIEGLEGSVDVYYDDYGIPHIYASSVGDAYKALGYVHAKDRLWQMDLIRRIAPGRLSELFGDGVLENDKFFRTIGLAHQSKLEAANFQKNANGELRDMVLGYVAGVNSYIGKGSKTVEHKLIGVEMEPFTLEDVYNVIGYMSYSFAVAHRTEPILDYITKTYGSDYMEALDVHVAPGSTFITSDSGPDYSPMSMHIDQLMEDLPVPELIGSNSWVIGPSRSETNGVLFANDPHIGYSQPSVWYEAHISAPDFELYGYHIAGFPLAQIGHNRHHAVGLTMFENDDIDYYRERSNPEHKGQYWAIDHWEDYKVRSETIKVKDGDDVTIEVRETRHGPVMSDVIAEVSSDDPVAMWWVYQKFPLRLLEASHKIITSHTLEEARDGAALIHAPGLNVMYGDVEGNIAWWAAAKLPKRPEHVNSKLILDGASGKDDITEFYDFNQNPQAVNPAKGYVYSANNQSLGTDSTQHPGYYLPEDRARRIVSLIEANDRWSVADMKKMLLDDTSDNAIEIRNSMLSAVSKNDLSASESEMLSIVEKWDGSFASKEKGPTIYVKWLYHVLHKMTIDELGERWATFNGTHLMKRSVQPLIANDAAPWWDDQSTSEKEAKADIVQAAFKQTVSELSATELGWGKVHTLEHAHAFSTNETLRSYFNVGPFEMSGSTDVINNQQYLLNGDGVYETKAGPSSRRVINLKDIDKDSWSILPTGQSGNVLSSFYKDQAEMFVKGEFRKQLMDKEEIVANSEHHSVFKPD